jgi:hypothetical protein
MTSSTPLPEQPMNPIKSEDELGGKLLWHK